MTMWAWIRRLLAPPVFEGDEDKTRVARWTNLLLWAEVLLVVMSSSLLPITGTFGQGAVPIASILVLCAIGLWVLRAGRVQLAGIVFAGSLWLVTTGLTLVSGGLRDQAPTSYFFVVIVAGLLLGGRVAIGFAAASALACGAVFYADLVGLLPANVMAGTGAFGISMLVSNLAMTATVLYLLVQSMGDALSDARRSASDLAKQGQELADLVDDRTRELARRTAYLGAATAVANEASRVLGDPQQLLSRAVSVISEQFGFYHVGIFLLDARREWAQLRAASSSGGQRMLDRKHRLRVGSQGIVGYVAARGEPRVALYVEEDAAFTANPDLPDTRAEMAVPLRARGEMIGVLDVQSREPEAFSEEDVQVLQALADQVSLAISSARLFVQLEGRLEAERQVYGELTREAWLALLRAQPDLGFLSDEHGTGPAGDLWRPEMQVALRTGEVASGDRDDPTLAMPITVRDQVVGVIDGRKKDGTPWTNEERELLQALAEQLNVALESAQLFRDAQRRELRERAVGQVATRMRESLDLDNVLQTAATEMRQALDLERVVVRLATTVIDSDAL